MARHGKALLRKLLHFMKWIPTSSKLLYPFWLSAQLDTVAEEAAFDNLPEAFDGFVIAYASDIHFGAFFDTGRAAELVIRLNAMNADVIILGGDYGETARTGTEFFTVIPALAAKQGVYAVIGNHDLLGSPEEIRTLEAEIASRGICLLKNSCVSLEKEGDAICLCATDDILEGKPLFDSILPAVRDAKFTIFVPHSPDILPQAEKAEGFRFDLALCGHTHGGQLVIAGHSLHSSSAYGDAYARGWMEVHGGRLMVSHGVGTSLMPVRLGVRPQIHKITLRKAR